MPTLRSFALGAIAAAVVLAGCTSSPGSTPDAASAPATGTAAVIGKDPAAAYNARPLTGGQQTPAHVWLQQPDGKLQFYHLNNDDVTKATGVLFVGAGVPGKFCAGPGGITKEQYDAGYVHFHAKSAPNWDAGHNAAGNYADKDRDGYWLLHIGAVDTTMQMGGASMPVMKGKVFPLMPADFSKVQPCAGGAPASGTLGAMTAQFYTSKPLTGGQQTPAHLWFEQPDGTLLLLHFNHDDVSQATGLLFAGEANPGKLCLGDAGVTQAEYTAGYVHFHAKSAPNWDAGHNAAGNYAEKTKDGYWLRHIGAVDTTMQMGGTSMPVVKGEVFPLMPADLAQVLPC